MRAIRNKDRKTTTILFPDEGNGERTGEFYMRGAITFPERLAGTTRLEGYIVMAGMDVKTKIIYLFEERVWVTVQHFISGGKFLAEGVCTFLNQMHNDYYATYYYYYGQYESRRKYMNECYREKLIQPKPGFIQMDVRDEEEGIQAVLEKINMDQLIFTKGKGFHSAWNRYHASQNQEVLPALKSVVALIYGYNEHPWRDKK